MISTTTETSPQQGNADDQVYFGYLNSITARLDKTEGPLFTTDADDLFEIYLEAFADPVERQHHNCHCCRRFIQTYGGLVTIDSQGRTTPVFWDAGDAPDDQKAAIAAMARRVSRARVNGQFLTADAEWGTTRCGSWRHLSALPPPRLVFKGVTKWGAPGPVMAERVQDFQQVSRALAKYKIEHLNQALGLLETDALYRSEKVKGPVEWLFNLAKATSAAGRDLRSNLIWRAVATAPQGFAHPSSSMASTLLEDLADGLPVDVVAKRFAAKMSPIQYQRPTAAPAAGTIAQAEKIIESMGLASALRRRYARLDEVQSLWRPCPVVKAKPAGGVFGHLLDTPTPSLLEGPQLPPMTWDKFRRTVLPTAETISIVIANRRHYAFSSLVTAADPDALPLLKWDSPERRNPVSWYLYHNGSTPSQFSLTAGTHQVVAVALQPSMWNDETVEHHGKGVMFVIAGARDRRNESTAIFPETLRGELHGIRSVIAAHSERSKLEGEDEASASGVLAQPSAAKWDIRLSVTSQGRIANYNLDRWD